MHCEFGDALQNANGWHYRRLFAPVARDFNRSPQRTGIRMNFVRHAFHLIAQRTEFFPFLREKEKIFQYGTSFYTAFYTKSYWLL